MEQTKVHDSHGQHQRHNTGEDKHQTQRGDAQRIVVAELEKVVLRRHRTTRALTNVHKVCTAPGRPCVAHAPLWPTCVASPLSPPVRMDVGSARLHQAAYISQVKQLCAGTEQRGVDDVEQRKVARRGHEGVADRKVPLAPASTRAASAGELEASSKPLPPASGARAPGSRASGG